MLADDENLDRGKFFFQNLGRFQAIHGGHGDVEEHDVGLVLFDFVDGIDTVDGLANNFDIRFGAQNLADTPTDALTVVNYEHPKSATLHSHLPGEGLA